MRQLVIRLAAIGCLCLSFLTSTATGQTPYSPYFSGAAPQAATAVYPSHQPVGYSSPEFTQYHKPAPGMQPGVMAESYSSGDFGRPQPSQSRAGHVSYSQGPPSVSDPADKRAGLLGSSYLDAQYIFLSAPTSWEYANPFHGVRGTVNSPITWDPEVQDFFFQDIFVSARHLGMTTDIPGTFPPAEIEADWTSWGIGTTIFADVTPSFRPFIQLGYLRDDIRVQGQSAALYLESKESLSSLLLNVGSEFDITDNLGARIALELDHADFSDSFFTLEQVYWCTPNLFLRGGIVGDLGGTTIGAALGGGVAI